MENIYGIDLSKMVKITTGRDSNWAIYLKEESGMLYSVAIADGCNTTVFGTIDHLIRMCRMGYREYKDFTKEGLEVLSKRGFNFKNIELPND